MSKYVGLFLASAFALTWILQNVRDLFRKRGPATEISTGVRRGNYLVVGVFLFAAPMLLVVGGETLVKELWRESQWVPSTGFVTEHVEAGLYRGRPRYKARFHYQTSKETGEVDHEILDATAQANPPAVSEAVNVLYDPSNPEDAIINDSWSRWILPSILLAVGLFLMSFAGLAALEIMKFQKLRVLARPAPQVGHGEGRLLKIKKNWLLSIKNQPSYRLVVSYQDLAGRTHIADSEPIWQRHPETWAKKDVDVPLFIDRANPARAWVRINDYFQACQRAADSVARPTPEPFFRLPSGK